MSSKVIAGVILVVLIGIVIAPPIAHSYIYPSAGDDTADHLAVFDNLTSFWNCRYLGLPMAGYVIKALSQATGATTDSLFLWFNYLALVGACVVLFVTLTKLVNKWAGFFAIPIAVFCTQSILKLFYCGTIFHIINMYLVLPLAVFFLISWIQEKKNYQLVLAYGLFLLFSTAHLTSLYLVGTMGLFLAFVITYKVAANRDEIDLKKVVPAISGIMVMNLASAWATLPEFGQHISETVARAAGITEQPITPPSFGNFSMVYAGYVTLGILLPALLLVLRERGHLEVQLKTKLFLGFLAALVIFLAIGAFTRISPDPIRVALDLSVTIAILTVCLVGIGLEATKGKKVMVLAVCALVAVGILLSVPHWLSYTSAVRPADIQAIEYLNSQSNSTYSCSTQVAPWIYNRWLEKEYVADGNGEYVIYRDKPMTARTDPNQYWYQYKDRAVSQLDNYSNLTLLRKFSDGEVSVYVFKGDSS